mmetsp:Transcript_24666/g.49077  ORF Transcript_24666/g.49077 Transcript_24666/m.49077 type:complete len:229 (-) Transcript_24666:312-998(-)
MKLSTPIVALCAFFAIPSSVLSSEGGIDSAHCPLKCYNGSCKYIEDSAQYYCECPSDSSGYRMWQGTRCETPVKVCVDSKVGKWECLNDSNCNMSTGTCSCVNGFSGPQCMDGPAICFDGKTKCYNGGQCHVYETKEGDSSCRCREGFTGDECRTQIDFVPPNRVVLDKTVLSIVGTGIIILAVLSGIVGSVIGVKRFKSGIDHKHMNENSVADLSLETEKEPEDNIL